MLQLQPTNGEATGLWSCRLLVQLHLAIHKSAFVQLQGLLYQARKERMATSRGSLLISYFLSIVPDIVSSTAACERSRCSKRTVPSRLSGNSSWKKHHFCFKALLHTDDAPRKCRCLISPLPHTQMPIEAPGLRPNIFHFQPPDSSLERLI